MKVWSRGLGKQALNADWYKTDLSTDGNSLVAKGIVRDKGIIWDCQFTFTKDDLPGLLYMIFSYSLLRHFLSNIKYVLTFGYMRLIKRGACKERLGQKAKSSS
jgi:hypothetical protein